MLNKNITANYVKNTDEMPLFMEINSNYIYGLKSVRESILLMFICYNSWKILKKRRSKWFLIETKLYLTYVQVSPKLLLLVAFRVN